MEQKFLEFILENILESPNDAVLDKTESEGEIVFNVKVQYITISYKKILLCIK